MKRRHLEMTENRTRRSTGFSLIEILITIAIAFIVAAIAVPSCMQTYRTYQLNSAASQVEMMFKYTRLEAIRLNTPISCWSGLLANGNYQVWADSNKIGNGVPQATEKQITLYPSGNMTAGGGVPNTTPIVAATGGAGLNVIAPATAAMLQFDQRGAVVNPAGVYAVFIGNTLVPTAGYRAVIIFPSGSTQIWAAGAHGGWAQTN